MHPRRRLLPILFFLCAAIGPRVFAEDILTVQRAIQSAIQHNLTQKLARAATKEARARALLTASSLLPQVTGSLHQSRVFKVNLEAQGFPVTSPLFNPLVGPFNSFDARLTLAQRLLDGRAFYAWRAGKEAQQVAELQERLARDQVAAAAALAYLEAMRTKRAVAAAQADLDLSESLLRLANDRHRAGVSSRMDVARAQTRQSQEHLRLIRSQLAVTQADLKLKRVMGIPLDQGLELPEVPAWETGENPPLQMALQKAQEGRAERLIAQAAYQVALLEERAARAERWPSLMALADYGHSGTTPEKTARTGRIGAQLDVPIFSGGGIRAHMLEQSARQQEARDQYEDIQTQLEEDVRLALETLKAEGVATQTANQTVALAQQEVKLAKDRFANGLGDNIQVIEAQTTLARALDDQVEAFARLDIARVNLASATGHVQEFQ